MNDTDKTKEQLLMEVAALRQQVVDLKAAQRASTRPKQAAITLDNARLHDRVQQEQARHVKKLRKGRNSIAAVLDATEVLVMLLDEQGRINWLNQAATQCSGYGLAEVQGQYFWELLAPEEIVRARSLFTQRAAQAGKLKYQCQLLTRSGQRRLTAWTIARPPQGEANPYLVMTGLDLTELKQAETALRENEHNFRTFFNTLDYLLFVLDNQGRIIWTNETVTNRLGYTQAEMNGQSVLMVHPPQWRDEAAQIVQAMLLGQADYCPVPVLTKDGRLIPVETRVSQGQWSGQEVIFGVTKDLSALKASEEKFAKIFQASPMLMAISEPDTGRYFEVNDAFLHTLGYTRDEIIGHTARELDLFVQPEQRAMALQILQARGHLRDFEAAVRAKSGEVHEGLFAVEYIQLQDRPVLLTVMHDITKRKQMEQALRESKEQFQALLHATESFIQFPVGQPNYQFLTDELLKLTGARYVVFNLYHQNGTKSTNIAISGVATEIRRATELLGFEVAGREWPIDPQRVHTIRVGKLARFASLRELAAEAIPEETALLLQEAFKLGEAFVIAITHAGQAIGDFSLLMPAGQTVQNPHLVQLYAEQVGLALMRSRAEQALQASEERLELFFTQSMAGFFFMMLDEPVRWDDTVDKEAVLDYVFDHQRLTKVNRAMLEQYGLAEEEMLGLTPRHFFAHNLAYGRRIWREFFDRGRLHIDTDERRADGSQVWIDRDYICLYDPDRRITGHFGVQRDVTAQKLAEAALRRANAELQAQNEELDAFARTVAHNLKNPICALTGLAELLARDHRLLPAEELTGYLDSINRSGRKAGRIIEELLLLAGVRRQPVQVEPLDMANIVAEALQRLAGLIAEYQAEIILPATWPVALGYAPWIEEVWVNYLSNGLKYGGQPPRLVLEATAPADGQVCFWVWDNGPGLSPEAQQVLFTEFVRLEPDRVDGYGLGLAIVRRIIEKLGGQVGVESEGKPGQGCIFSFTLPSQPPERMRPRF